ncbi:MAG: hypothetical protein C4532_04490 [Candidatus Abyssobacteria bacterium SURF_17]|uniref:Uncharacterized protein n=1 Tax=Candidatus Abyssobacteria bacterium SURF_17 TaxID=2093361 RepID=A0A419F4I0_9BACT|nr:MAG: hypothetical protein C4532_04490 [Candidatus Abyssubacteria bacterium SURF_17]
MAFTGPLPRLAVAFAVVVIALAVSAHTCLAGAPQPADSEPFAPTDHLIGDTLARGIDCLLNPAHLGLSRLYFWMAEPSMPEHVTTIQMMEATPEPREPVDQQTGFDSP